MNRLLLGCITLALTIRPIPVLAFEPPCPDAPVVRPVRGKTEVVLSVFAQQGEQFKIGLNPSRSSSVSTQTYTTPVSLLIPSGTTTLSVTGEQMSRCWRFIVPPERPSLVRIYSKRAGLLWPGLGLVVGGVGVLGGGAALVVMGSNTLAEGTSVLDFERADRQFYGGMGLIIGGVLIAGAGALMTHFGLMPGVSVESVPADLPLPPVENSRLPAF